MKIKLLTPVRAIRLKCLECGGRPKEIRLCQAKDCPLYAYRLGKNPMRAGIGGRKAFFTPKPPPLKLVFLSKLWHPYKLACILEKRLQMNEEKKCEYILADGSMCKAWSLTDKNYCFSHDPENREAKLLAVTKGGQSKEIKIKAPLRKIELNVPKDVILLLSETIGEIRSGELDPRIGSVIGYLAGQLLRAFEITQVNEKMEAMKEIIESRPRQRDVYGR